MNKNLHKQARCLIVVIVVVAGCALFAIGGYTLFAMPKYIVLPIESPSAYLPRGEWISTTFSTYNFTEQQDRYFIWRRESEVYTVIYDPRSPFDSWESIQGYFNYQFVDDGWTLYQSNSYDPCVLYLPEAKFLPRGPGGYLVYRKTGTIAYAAEPTICLAIWPSRLEQAEVNAYYVVILTINPSRLTVWNSQLDLGK